jgi:murein DD-endopeptidase MepM/ murein hydrolase activator NlpD
MANDSLTLIVVPHAKARFRRFQVSVRLVKWTAATAAVLSLAMAGVLVHYTRIRVSASELNRLRVENEVLRGKTKEYEENAGRLQARLLALQTTVAKLGVMAGLERSLPDATIGGAGGVAGAEAVAPQIPLPEMEARALDLQERSVQLESFYRDQTILLASTPSIWPVRGYLSSGFGNRIDPFTGQKDFHPGIDISTPHGTPIHAPADGLVVSTSRQGAYGNALVLDHGYGVVTRYGHLEAFNVTPGQRVRRGDVIAFVGSTGRSTSPHVHYEVWVRDQAQNPIHFILDEYRSFG